MGDCRTRLSGRAGSWTACRPSDYLLTCLLTWTRLRHRSLVEQALFPLVLPHSSSLQVKEWVRSTNSGVARPTDRVEPKWQSRDTAVISMSQQSHHNSTAGQYHTSTPTPRNSSHLPLQLRLTATHPQLLRHRIRREPRLLHPIIPLQPHHPILQRRRHMHSILPPHATLVDASPVLRPARPRFLAEPSRRVGLGVDHVELGGVGVEDDGVGEAGDVAVVVADAEVV